MVTNDSTDSSAADALDQSPEQDSSDSDSGYTCYLPSDFPGADSLKAGDTITLKVVGKDAEGDIEVEHANGGSSPDDKGMMANFDQEVGTK